MFSSITDFTYAAYSQLINSIIMVILPNGLNWSIPAGIRLPAADMNKIITVVKNLHIPDKYPSLYGDGNCAKKICDF